MTPEALKAAVTEAKRFLEKAAKVETKKWETYAGQKRTGIKQGKESAAVKRASLDLTRALASMRKP